MSDRNETGSLVKFTESDLVGQDLRVSREPLTLEEARHILAVAVGTNENTFTEGSDLSRVGSIDAELLRQALLVVAQNIIQSSAGGDRIRKQTPQGRLSLILRRRVDKEFRMGEPENLYMSLESAGKFILESEVALRGDNSWVRQDAIRFSDFRGGTRVVSGYRLRQDFTLDGFRHIWRGVRWLSANMLNWNGEFKLPEDLDKIYTPSSGKQLPPAHR